MEPVTRHNSVDLFFERLRAIAVEEHMGGIYPYVVALAGLQAFSAYVNQVLVKRFQLFQEMFIMRSVYGVHGGHLQEGAKKLCREATNNTKYFNCLPGYPGIALSEIEYS